MEPRQLNKPLEDRPEGQGAPAPSAERKRRFRIVKLEERIAPNNGKHSDLGCGHTAHRNCYGY
jgi:hypothetical protein